jgi:hypothetical protein
MANVAAEALAYATELYVAQDTRLDSSLKCENDLLLPQVLKNGCDVGENICQILLQVKVRPHVIQIVRLRNRIQRLKRLLKESCQVSPANVFLNPSPAIS